MVSNEDINKRLEGKRNGSNTHELILESHETTSEDFKIVCTECGTENPSISNFCSECGNPIEVKHPGYVVCDICYGIYELEEGESPEDFVNSQCECGGNLTYIHDMDELEDLTKNCPICGHINSYHVKRCEKCGRCFDIGVEYFESLLQDIEITPSALRIYNKDDKKLTDVYEYDFDKITNFRIVKEKVRPKIKFNYGNNNINIKITSKQAHNLKKLFKISPKIVVCTNYNCRYHRALNEDEKCPECGKVTKALEIDLYDKLTARRLSQKQKIQNKVRERQLEKHQAKIRYGHCLNVNCEHTSILQIGQKCPRCGTAADKVDFRETGKIMSAKKMLSKNLREKERIDKGIYQGKDGQVQLYENKIELKHTGLSMLFSAPFKEILNEDLISVKIIPFKKDWILKIKYRGEKRSVIGNDSSLILYKEKFNGITFKSSQVKQFRVLRSILEDRIKENKNTQSSTLNETKNNLNDLEKLAELKDKGIITEEEFNLKKKHILRL